MSLAAKRSPCTREGAMLNRQGVFSTRDRDRYRREGVSPGSNPTTHVPTADQATRSDVPKVEADIARPRAEEQKGSRLIVGQDIKLKGAEIADCDTLIVEGRVEAAMNARVIQVAENGAYHGIVEVEIAEIRGRFEGELTARKQLVIRPGGKVSGKIRYGKVLIEDGGELTGDIGTLAAAKPVALPTPKPAA